MPAELVETDRLLLRRFNRRDTAALEQSVRASLVDLHEWLPWAQMDYTRDDAVARTPVRRIGEPQDVANACVFLCQDESSYITGQVIGVNGGCNT